MNRAKSLGALKYTLPFLLLVTGANSALAAKGGIPGSAGSPGGVVLTKENHLKKAGSALSLVHLQHADHVARGVAEPFDPKNASLRYANGWIQVDAYASGDVQTLLQDLEGLKLRDSAAAGSLVSGWLPVGRIKQAAKLKSLRSIYAARLPQRNVGSVTSQADIAMYSDDARSIFGVDGSGVTVGVLSDSYDCLGGEAADIASGDLPSGVVVRQDFTGCSGAIDEGRGMMQLVHDIAPGSGLAFYSAFNSMADFAIGIVDLAANAGADVIVDDIIYLNEPMFEDGVVAQAVDEVVNDYGVAYFSSAGNQAQQSYEAAFVDSGISGEYANMHDFDPSGGVDTYQSITIPAWSSITIVLQWDQPFGSCANDVDLFLYNASSGGLVAASASHNPTTGDPYERLDYTNFTGSDKNLNIAIELYSGASPGLMKYVYYASGDVAINEYQTNSSTLYGHANAAGAEAVGAAFYGDTPAYGISPPLLEYFSSWGGTPILFGVDSPPLVREKPEITAPDGTNTTFFGSGDVEGDSFPNFFGTSAAAPHAAAVAALMKESISALQPDDIYTAMETTAIDMDDPGWGHDSGHGLIDANSAVSAACGGAYDIPANEWRLISLPCDPGSGAMTVTDVFGDDLDTNNYTSTWIVIERRNNAYNTLGLDSALEVGRGYWFKSLSDDVRIDVEATPTTLYSVAGCIAGSDCFTVPVSSPSAGQSKLYNMVGHPLHYAVDWADVRFVVDGAGANPYTPSGAEADGYVSKTFYTYSGNSWIACDDFAIGCDGTLGRYDGFLVKAIDDAAPGPISMLIPSERSSTAFVLSGEQSIVQLSGSAAFLPEGASRRGAEERSWLDIGLDWIFPSAHAVKQVVIPMEPPGLKKRDLHKNAHKQAIKRKTEWFVSLTAASSDEKLEDSGNVLGQLSDSEYGFDMHDLVEIPPFGTPYLTIVFPHPEWGEQAGDYTSDFHPLSKGNQLDTWDFEVRTNDPSREIVLSWSGLDEVLNGSQLIDQGTGEVVEIASVKDYSFTMNGSVRKFTWQYVGKKPKH